MGFPASLKVSYDDDGCPFILFVRTLGRGPKAGPLTSSVSSLVSSPTLASRATFSTTSSSIYMSSSLPRGVAERIVSSVKGWSPLVAVGSVGRLDCLVRTVVSVFELKVVMPLLG